MKDIAFLFDVGNVMIDFDLRSLVERISAASGVPSDALLANWFDDALMEVETGKVEPRRYYGEFSARIGLAWSYDQWIDNWASIYQVNDVGRPLFLELRRMHQTCTLSNLAEFHMTAIERKFPGFFGCSSRNFFSYELGYHKPDRDIYLKACDSLGVRPANCIFLDDSPENVLGAREAGLRALQFVPENYAAIHRLLKDYTASSTI